MEVAAPRFRSKWPASTSCIGGPAFVRDVRHVELASLEGMKATFGIRREDIAILPPGVQAPGPRSTQVTVVEPLGAEFLLSLRC
jgi:hypothetical protein